MSNEETGGEPPAKGSVQVQPVAARVSESASRGAFSTGVVLLTGSNEFIVDFVQNLGAPTSVVARVIIPHGAMASIIDAIERNVVGHEERFGTIAGVGEANTSSPQGVDEQTEANPLGEPAQEPTLQPEDLTSEQLVGIGQVASSGTTEAKEPTAQDIYDDIRMDLEVESGEYANALMIGHTASEFKLDFIAKLYPKSIVTSRIYLSSPQLLRVLASMKRTFAQFMDRRSQGES